MTLDEFDVAFARSFFPALQTPWALFDNAGGSVPARTVIERVTDYMSRFAVQLGASYALSAEAQRRVRQGEAAAAKLIGASTEETVVGPSTTVNVATLARALSPTFSPGDRVVVTDLDHEANIGAWRQLEAQGMEVVTWRMRPDLARLVPEDLDALLTDRTRLVAFTQCANVVGELVDVAAIAKRIRERSPALVCVDGVAFAPHRYVDVKTLDVDFYLLSLYKVYGPHLAVLYGRRDHLRAAKGQNHFFVPEHQLPYKFQPGNVTHELAAGLPGILEYFDALASHHGIDGSPRLRLRRVFDRIADHEARLAARLLDFLGDHPRVRVLGPTDASPRTRVPTIAFTVDGMPSSQVVGALEEARIAIRYGHFYAKRAIDALGLDPAQGVARVSLVHYNTVDEVDRLVESLGEILTAAG